MSILESCSAVRSARLLPIMRINRQLTALPRMRSTALGLSGWRRKSASRHKSGPLTAGRSLQQYVRLSST